MTETVGNSMFCGPETDCPCFRGFASVADSGINNYFIIYQESRKRKNKANFIQEYLKYFIHFLKSVKFNSVHNVIHRTFAGFGCPKVACSRDCARDFFYSPVNNALSPRALMRGRQSNSHNLT